MCRNYSIYLKKDRNWLKETAVHKITRKACGLCCGPNLQERDSEQHETASTWEHRCSGHNRSLLQWHLPGFWCTLESAAWVSVTETQQHNFWIRNFHWSECHWSRYYDRLLTLLNTAAQYFFFFETILSCRQAKKGRKMVSHVSFVSPKLYKCTPNWQILFFIHMTSCRKVQKM